MDLYISVIGSILAAILLWKIIQIYTAFVEACSSRKAHSLGKFHPIWGHLHLFSDWAEFFVQLDKLNTEKNPRMVYFWIMLIRPIFVVTHPDTAKTILKSTEPKSKQFGGPYFTFLPWLGDGLLLSDGKKWKRNRRLLTPAFHFDVLKPYVRVYNEVFDIFLENVNEVANHGCSVEIYEHVRLATLDTMLRCTLSYDGKVQDNGLRHAYVKAVCRLTHLSNLRLLRPWLYPTFIFRLTEVGKEYFKHATYIHNFDEKVIRERKETLKDDPTVLGKQHLDFLDILLSAKDENGVGLTDLEIRNEVDTFLFEGHDTTASALSWAIYSLAKYPNEQQKVYEEIEDILGDKKQVEWSDIQKFTQLSLFIKESMRMHSPVPGVARLLKHDLEIDGVMIPAQTDVIILIHSINMREDVWGNPEEFCPGRFACETERDPYSYIPFSAGPRNCIGQNFAMDELKVALAKLVQRFRVLPDPERVPDLYPELIMRARNGIHVMLEKRK